MAEGINYVVVMGGEIAEPKRHVSADSAFERAAELARENPGKYVHVLEEYDPRGPRIKRGPVGRGATDGC